MDEAGQADREVEKEIEEVDYGENEEHEGDAVLEALAEEDDGVQHVAGHAQDHGYLYDTM